MLRSGFVIGVLVIALVIVLTPRRCGPGLDHPGDLRLLGELSILSKLVSRVALENSFTIAYDRTPPDGVRRHDTQLEVAIVVTL